MGPLQLCNSLHIIIVLCSATSTSSMAGIGSGTNKALTRLQTPIVPVPTGKWVPTHLCSNASPNTNSATIFWSRPVPTGKWVPTHLHLTRLQTPIVPVPTGEVGSNTSSSNASPNTNSANNVSNTSSSNASPNTNSAPPSNATPNTNSASNVSNKYIQCTVTDLSAALCSATSGEHCSGSLRHSLHIVIGLAPLRHTHTSSALGLALTQTTLVHMANPNSVVCQFMEDALAAEDRICECPSCRAQITKGQPCFYVATMQPGRSGRNKPTTSQPALRQHPSSPASQRWPDPKAIRQSVNASQWKSSVNPPRVVAIPDWTNTSMGPTACPSALRPYNWS
ncbi:hypothetical protein DFJ58DRAFT_883325 [Suillus subalutaceus]|uniref:uncharacterized protein n=1 Tax=Suillus subalutaceus TaxID=48586 RepID=UPI001B87DBE1|nr:uncharacterized protein DFJ58DRAFT_883325 [Suillus subalutaceus]KAG1824249.1 hypothetical protein DFJ58DRAFT_883325 [Suillus subalutaceus]